MLIREWIKNLIKEAIREQELEPRYDLIANRDPTHADYRFLIGSTWKNGNKIFVLEKMEATWKEQDKS